MDAALAMQHPSKRTAEVHADISLPLPGYHRDERQYYYFSDSFSLG
jgi:hypothetical protein